MTRVAQLIYPGDRYADVAARRLAAGIVQRLVLGCGPGDVLGAAAGFAGGLGAGEGSAGDLLDSMVSIEELQHVPLPPAMDDEHGRVSTQARVDYLRDLGNAIRDVAAANLAAVKPEHERALQASIAEQLGPPLGLNGARHFLSALAGRLRAVRTEIGLDKQEFERQRAELAPSYAAAEVESWRTGNGAGRYRQLVDQEGVLVFDIERHGAAIDLLTHVLDRVGDWRVRVTALAAACETLVEELLGEEERARRRPDLGPTAYEIDAPIRGARKLDGEAEAERFARWLDQETQHGPAPLLSLGRGELKDLLLRWAADHEAVRELRERRIDEVLAGMAADERRRHLRQLVTLATGEGEALPPTLYVFGVENEGETRLSKTELEELVPRGADVRLVSTADPRRVFCFGARP